MDYLSLDSDQLDELLRAIETNADVRLYDWIILGIAALALASTIAIAWWVARSTQRQRRQDARFTATNFVMGRLDALASQDLTGSADELRGEFIEGRQHILSTLPLVLPEEDANLVRLIQAEFDFAEQRLGITPWARAIRELSADVARDLSAYASNASYRSTLHTFLSRRSAHERFDIMDWIDAANAARKTKR